ncbi:uncharacterized protein CLUP02_17197 [Colletotrichum lupini]|uniref:Uncharacterized protein n=1 Tax=Colletotrichum lupini TaxID=145971 RepID=A0A9Q8TBL1_9PEZI|nr:uncharacterized protein CLUP02_17197 [Colletotrichum lupini]UQC91661.1 hypothetical protein CLUP02_17197 [Colletotrichum lupini]
MSSTYRRSARLACGGVQRIDSTQESETGTRWENGFVPWGASRAAAMEAPSTSPKSPDRLPPYLCNQCHDTVA